VRRVNDLNNLPKTETFEDILSLPVAEKVRRGLEHTPAEINQQPHTWIETFRTFEKRQEDIRRFLFGSGLTPASAGRLCVTLIGAGTSDYVGRAIESLLRKEWKCHVLTVPSTDLMTEMVDFVASTPKGSRQLWISFSRSGDSFEGVKVLERALREYPQIDHLIITCSSSGRMAAEIARGRTNVLCLELDDKVNDRGLAMTSSFTNMVIAGQCLAHIADLSCYESILDELSAAATEVLSKAPALAWKTAAGKPARICFLGSGPLRAVADESALKVMELSAGYHSTMSESFLGLRHGPLSWLNRDALVVGYLSNDREKAKVELGLFAEICRKQAAESIVAIIPRERADLDLYADQSICLGISALLSDQYRPPVDVIFAQLLGLFSSISLGLKPDSPSADGKIQRVVSDIGAI